MTAALDRRLVTAGLSVTVVELAEILRDHWPYRQPISQSWTRCPGCGHEYTAEAPECPTSATVRPLLYRRRNETPDKVLTPDELKALEKPPVDPAAQPRRRRASRKAGPPEVPGSVGLFDLADLPNVSARQPM
ncbi:MAG: hypothetical protein ACRD2Z_09430 [Thermoanaerobaculia bacterium]